MKLDESRSIERLEQSLKAINSKYALNNKANDLLSLVEDTIYKLKDLNFYDEVSIYQAVKDKEI
jgi:hypothetical protein